MKDNPRWLAVEDIRARLQKERNSDARADEWEQAWAALMNVHGEGAGEPWFGHARTRTDGEPLAAIMMCLSMDMYPPPELMIWLGDALSKWLTSKDAMETALLGAPKRKGGGYRVRYLKSLENSWYAFKLAKVQEEQHLGAEQAAKVVVREERLSISPKSLLQRLRKKKPAFGTEV